MKLTCISLLITVYDELYYMSKHCAFLGKDRLTFLMQSTKEDIMTFLK